MSGPRIAYVLGTSSGGTGAHVAMLAAGCAARGASVTVYGPASAGERFFTSPSEPKGRAAVWTDERGGEGAGARREDGGSQRPGGERGPERPVAFEPVEIAGRVRPARDAAAVLRLRRLLRRAEPGVVHAHGLRAGALAAVALSLAARPRPALLVTVHNAPPAGRISGLVYGLLERVIARRADAVTWVSGDLAARLRRLGARDGGRALVPAPPGPAPSPAQAAAARAGLGGAGRPLVLAAGRLAAQKGISVLLEAAARWRDTDPAPLVAVAGDGPLAGPLRAQARAAGLDVAFLGQRSDIPALLAAAEVVTVPSYWEGQPLIVQEALRAGRPIVASRAGGIPELTGEDAALLVPPGDAPALAAAVRSVLADPGLAARLSGAALARAAALPTPADAAGAALALYQQVTAARPRRS